MTTDLATLTNEALDLALAAEIESTRLAGLDGSELLDALFVERLERIAARRAEIAADEAAWEREIAATARAERIVKLDLTPRQADVVFDFLHILGRDAERVTVGATWARMPREIAGDLAEAIGASASDAVDLFDGGNAQTESEIAFAERQIATLYRNVVAKLRRAAR
jgi:hypothetical protein